MADDDASRSKGLSNRHTLLPDGAMLFIFPEEDLRRFWMKDTLLPLDMLFMDSDGRIVDIQTMKPEPGVPDEQLTIYQSPVPAIYALEMNAGLAEVHGFEVGMQVELELRNSAISPYGLDGCENPSWPPLTKGRNFSRILSYHTTAK